MKRLLLAAALSLLTAGSAMAQTVILVRHAEKTVGGSDPVLSEAGVARAEALAARLSNTHIDAILTSPLQRTRQTALPSGLAHSVEAEAVPLDGGTEAHVAAVVARIRALGEDATILVVGHSNTVPLIARALGQQTPDMPECEYDRLITLNMEGGGVMGVTMRYGAPSTC
jgi:broad specificity phosphatase PhoE